MVGVVKMLIALRKAQLERPSTINAVITLNFGRWGVRYDTQAALQDILRRLGFGGFGDLSHDGKMVIGWHLKLYDSDVINAAYHAAAYARYREGHGHPKECVCCHDTYIVVE
jgi:hypothetical protein